MAFKDLREFIDKVDGLGQLKRVEGASWDLELGAISEIAASLRSCPMLYFDRIGEYRAGLRVLTNILHTEQRLSVALGGSPDLKGIEVVRLWKKALAGISKGYSPVMVADGPVKEHIKAEDINILDFPIPKWHEGDGGRYIAGATTIMREPEEGWINLGVYRIQVHSGSTLVMMLTPGKNGRIILEKYWARGESCPVAISLGHAPSLLLASSVAVPWGKSEYDFAGAINDEPIEVIPGAYTKLPVPSTAELVIEGEVPPIAIESLEEGPFGEATGYYSFEETRQPVVKIKCIMYRNDPIIMGVPPMRPFPGLAQFAVDQRLATLWNNLEECGVPGIQGVWRYCYGFTVISLKQAYPGHAKQAALIATGSRATYAERAVVIVDDDIDPTNILEVIWAISTRCDPERGVEIVKEGWSSNLDPVISSSEKNRGNTTSARIIINACIPFWRKGEFPRANRMSSETKARIWQKITPFLREGDDLADRIQL